MSEKKPPPCDHVLEDVTSRDGVKLYGWRCARCTKQWQASTCVSCGLVRQHVASQSRTRWMCGPCKKAEAAKWDGGGA